MKNVTFNLEEVSYYKAYVANDKTIIGGIKLVEPNGIITEINNRYIENLEDFTLQELMYKPFKKETKTNCICNGYNYLNDFVKILWLQVERITDREELESEDIFQKIYKKIITFEIDGKYTFEHVLHYTRRELTPLGLELKKLKEDLNELGLKELANCYQLDKMIKYYSIKKKPYPSSKKFKKIIKKFDVMDEDIWIDEKCFTATFKFGKEYFYRLFFEFDIDNKKTTLKFRKLNYNASLRERLDLINATEKTTYNSWQEAFKNLEQFIKDNLKDEATNK